ncbi:MAG: DUF4430 domain-containing protein [Actinomycetota bacterium]|nr:DUF4430 domain-containing protein [Actinomycetota bacterium]
MRRRRRSAEVAAGLALAVILAGCGLGPGESSEGNATITVTRDYGTSPVLEASVEEPAETETVLRLLDREADIETRYGGGFVQSIEGVSGEVEAGRNFDWFFYVNGIESPIGSADRTVEAGDRVWWDHRDWTDAMRVPAVVGSWPEPLAQTSAGGDRLPVDLECAGAPEPCAMARKRLLEQGIEPGHGGPEEGEALRVLVGAWSRLQDDPAAALLQDGPGESGVFVRFERSGSITGLVALDVRAAPARRLGAGAGLVAAVRVGERPPTWIVTGVDKDGVAAAAAALSESVLRNRFAVIVAARSDETLPVPVVEGP